LTRIALERALTENDPRFAPGMVGEALSLPSSFSNEFDEGGALLDFARGADRRTSIALSAFGRAGSTWQAARARVAIVGPEIRLVRDAMPSLIEWWRSLPSGLEHGVTITERPKGRGALIVEMAVGGQLRPRRLRDDAVALVDEAGREQALYASLYALSADGSSVPARLDVRGHHVIIEIDDTNATYPLVIDPLVTAIEGTLLAQGRADFDSFGWSVALNQDGTRAIVGALYDATELGYDAGTARIFVRTGATWIEEQMLSAPDAQDTDQFGSSVSITADGSRVLIGASGDFVGSVRTGSARVFVRSGARWTHEQMLTSTRGGADERFGSAAAISADGTRAIVGAYWADTAAGTNAGNARIFLRSGSTWTLEQMLVAPSGARDEWFGYSVALNADGTRAVIGVPYDDNGGSARVFSRRGATWVEEAMLQASDAMGGDYLGRSVAISGDGSRVLAGAWGDDVLGQVDAGSARVFVRSGVMWREEATLIAVGGAAGDRLGWAVSLNHRGDRAIVGAPEDDTAVGETAGTAHIFTRTDATWTAEASLAPSRAAATDFFGDSVAMSGDGLRALVGADHDDRNAGSAHVFTLVTPCVPDAGSCDAGMGNDAGIPNDAAMSPDAGTDAGDSRDAAISRRDAALSQDAGRRDAGIHDAGGSSFMDAGSAPISGGCTCRVSSENRTPNPLALVLLAVLLIGRSRRNRRRHSKRNTRKLIDPN
jgi:MYXO-CTERM domain-containing protein